MSGEYKNALLDEARNFVQKWNNEEVVLSHETKDMEFTYYRPTVDFKKELKDEGTFDTIFAKIVTKFKALDEKYSEAARTSFEKKVAYFVNQNQIHDTALIELIYILDIARAKRVLVPGPATERKINELNEQLSTALQQSENRSQQLVANETDLNNTKAELADAKIALNDAKDKMQFMFDKCPKCGFKIERGSTQSGDIHSSDKDTRKDDEDPLWRP